MYNSDLPSRAELPSSRQLLRSTLIAIVAAIAILVAVVLPAEYGIDPTGVGGVLGLTEMGEIKQQLADEAAADQSPDAAEAAAATSPAAIEDVTEQIATASPDQPLPTDGTGAEIVWRDVLSRTLAPAEGKEIKLVMQQGQQAIYEWSVDKGHLNSDLHTDNGPGGRSLSYRQGRAETSVADDFTAATDGAHGWFWRNRSDETVTVTLRVRGDYGEVRR